MGTLQGEYILAGVFVKIQSLVVSDFVFAKKNSITLLFFFQDRWFEGSPHFLKSYFAVFFGTLLKVSTRSKRRPDFLPGLVGDEESF